MDACPQSSRSSRPRRAQRVLPTLTPAAPSSGSPSDTMHKVEQLQIQERPSTSKATPRMNSFRTHIFFNRRPLDLIRRTTSSFLATSHTATTTSIVAPLATAEERKAWQPQRPLGEKSGWRRLQQLQPKLQQQPRRIDRVLKAVNEQRDPARPIKRSLTLCTTSKHCTMEERNAAALTAFEQVEISQYKEIYFVSTLAIKRSRGHGDWETLMSDYGDKNVDDQSAESYNQGFDDDQGDYLMVIGDHLAFRYEVLSALGQGSFGQVVCCLDHLTCKLVAVKVIRNRPKYRLQALDEVKLLAHLRQAAAGEEKARVVRMEESFEFRGHVCIVFEVLGMNLYDYLKLRQFRGLPMPSVRTIATQLVQSLVLLKRERMIHCDLKPENLLLDADTTAADGVVTNVTLIDFGSSCLDSAPMFTYIQSRFYRSPEVLLGLQYSSAIDMWSFACILVELHTGHPIFAGENEQEQLACIMEVLDVPPVEMVRNCKRRLTLFEEVANPADRERVDYIPKQYVNTRGCHRTPGSRGLTSAVMSKDSEFVAFLSKCFVWDPSERLTPEQALKEPWLCRLE